MSCTALRDSDMFGESFKASRRFHGDSLLVYHPGNKFPAISLTGVSCQVNCKYCNAKYLQGMVSAQTPGDLVTFCQDLANKKGVGCLISGGYTSAGIVPFRDFISAFRTIKDTTNLFLNVHTGLVTSEEAESLADAGIDAASVDIVGDDRIIQDVIGLRNATVEDYRAALRSLTEAGIRSFPHIGLGFYFGQINIGLESSLEIALGVDPEVIVFLVLRPTPGTAMAHVTPPSAKRVAATISRAILESPKTEFALGCMRPRSEQLEESAMEAGITRIVLPKKRCLDAAKAKGLKIARKESCCIV